MIIYFAKDEKGWFLNANTSREEKSMTMGADTWLSKIQELDDPDTDVIRLAIEWGSTKHENITSPKYKNAGWSALYKQDELPSGGATYACPTVKGHHTNIYMWVPKAFEGLFGGNYPEIIYFNPR